MNMAVDEALLRAAVERGRPLLRVYSWRQPAVSIGYFQKFPAHLAGHYDIVRRPTGGGLVYHDGDTTYTVVLPPGHPLFEMIATESYCTIHKAVAAALAVEAQVLNSKPRASLTSDECFRNPVHGDVVVDGRKLAGAAQRRTKWGLLHQGSIAAKLTEVRIAEGFSEALGADFQPYRHGAEECVMAESLASGKYATNAWNKRIL